MKKIFYKEKNRIITLIVIQFTLSVLSLLNYSFEKPLINIDKEILYTILVVFVIFSNIIYFLSFYNKIDKKNSINNIKINSLVLNNLKEIDTFGEIGVLFYDDSFEVIWINDFLDSRMINIVGKNLIKYNNDFQLITEDKNETAKITINNRIYECKCLKELKMVIMKDVNQYENLLETYNNESPVILNITIDNYSDVLSLLDDTKTSELEARVRTTINEWSVNKRIFLKKIRNDAYVAVMQESSYKSILKEKFSLIDDIKNIYEEDNNFTISIGVGRGINDYVKLSELASSAVDVALSRGGDQCVVNTYGKNMEFYGGGSESKSKRHKVKVKVVSKSLTALIQASESVYIMGHIQSDFDSIGACLGMYSITKQMNKRVKIVYDDKLVEIKARSAFRQSFEKEEIDEMIIKPNKVLEEMNENSLLLLVDVSNPDITMSPKIVDAANKIAIIDHHRPGDKLLAQIFAYQESAASSACEMVSEIIRYSENKIRITPEVATYMLTGILLDTNNYKNRTGSRTYEASMILKEYGADNVQATEFLKDEYEEYQLKVKILANSETPYYGVVVCMADDEDIVDRSMLAKVGQEVLDVKEIKACFVIGKIEDTKVGISARSDGTINVQKIMESLNGGGHFSSAATQIETSSIEEVKKMLYSKLESFVGDTRIE